MSTFMRCGCLFWITVSALASVPSNGAGIATTITGPNGMPLEDAVVYATPVNAGASMPAPRNAEIDQRNKTFVPVVSVVQTGTSVSFPNSDNIRHQVYSFSPAKIFNIKLYSGRPSEPVVFDKPGVVVLGCNIHDRMVAWVVVVDTPWFSRTDAEGHALIRDLPAGEYVLSSWHPGLRGDPVTHRVQLVADERHEEALQLEVTLLPQAGHAGHEGGASP
jgi:plastocyanin